MAQNTDAHTACGLLVGPFASTLALNFSVKTCIDWPRGLVILPLNRFNEIHLSEWSGLMNTVQSWHGILVAIKIRAVLRFTAVHVPLH